MRREQERAPGGVRATALAKAGSSGVDTNLPCFIQRLQHRLKAFVYSSLMQGLHLGRREDMWRCAAGSDTKPARGTHVDAQCGKMEPYLCNAL